jgi:hypothetical protein
MSMELSGKEKPAAARILNLDGVTMHYTYSSGRGQTGVRRVRLHSTARLDLW